MLHVFSYLILTVILFDVYYQHYFAEGETEAKQSQIMCGRAQDKHN